MSYKEYAKTEFKFANWVDEDGKFNDEMQEMMCKQVLELLDLFDKHGHSGFSAPYAINLFKNLADFKPITPLTGEESEWVEIENKWQNKRFSSVFKDSDGRAYNSQGKVFREPNGACYTNSDSHVYIKFPYTPSIEYVDVNEKS